MILKIKMRIIKIYKKDLILIMKNYQMRMNKIKNINLSKYNIRIQLNN